MEISKKKLGVTIFLYKNRLAKNLYLWYYFHNVTEGHIVRLYNEINEHRCTQYGIHPETVLFFCS